MPGGPYQINTSEASVVASDFRGVTEGLPSNPILAYLPGAGSEVVGAHNDAKSGVDAVRATLETITSAAATRIGNTITNANAADNGGMGPF